MAPILVTGGLGLIGSHVVDQMGVRPGGIAVPACTNARANHRAPVLRIPFGVSTLPGPSITSFAGAVAAAP